MNLLRRKLKLRQPYVGVFLKRDKTNEKDTVDKLSDIYDVGSFCQIQEFQDLGDKLRMVAVSHRRIRIVQQLYDEAPPDSKQKHDDAEMTKLFDDKPSPSEVRSRFKKIQRPKDRKKEKKPRPLTTNEQQSVMMVEVENVKAIDDVESDEVKALTQEIIKTLRDIISSNVLYRENLQHMINNNQRVVNNPSYLCDLGATLSSGENTDLQEVLSEEDVRTIFGRNFGNLIPFGCVIFSCRSQNGYG